MEIGMLLATVADYLKEFDATMPVHKAFQPGIGPFGEPQLVAQIAAGLTARGIPCRTRRQPDLEVGQQEWAIELKIARPFGDNGKEAENWTVNLLHPYEGNVSSIGDALKLRKLIGYSHRAVLVIGYEHDPARIPLEPLVRSFELIAQKVLGIVLSPRYEETRHGLVHREHQTVRCYAWEVYP